MLRILQTGHFIFGDPILSRLSHQNTPLHQFSRFVQNCLKYSKWGQL